MAAPQRKPAASRQELIAAYKGLLRGYLDQRPSGARQKIARVLGTHKSFVSQITNPADPTPIPARHVGPILEVLHLSEAEHRRFLQAYRAAHPKQASGVSPPGQPHLKTLHLEVPVLDDPEAQAELESLIRDFARRSGEAMARTLRKSRE